LNENKEKEEEDLRFKEVYSMFNVKPDFSIEVADLNVTQITIGRNTLYKCSG
jgi:hypothetical protein